MLIFIQGLAIPALNTQSPLRSTSRYVETDETLKYLLMIEEFLQKRWAEKPDEQTRLELDLIATVIAVARPGNS